MCDTSEIGKSAEIATYEIGKSAEITGFEIRKSAKMFYNQLIYNILY